jgi:hypothetical protein
MDAKSKLALSRLRKWSDPKAMGSPTGRMTQIWSRPIEMAQDIHVLLALVDSKQEAN